MTAGYFWIIASWCFATLTTFSICSFIQQLRKSRLHKSQLSSSKSPAAPCKFRSLMCPQQVKLTADTVASNGSWLPVNPADRTGFYEVSQSLSIMMCLILPVNKTALGASAVRQAPLLLLIVWEWGRWASRAGRRGDKDGSIIDESLQRRVTQPSAPWIDWIKLFYQKNLQLKRRPFSFFHSPKEPGFANIF